MTVAPSEVKVEDKIQERLETLQADVAELHEIYKSVKRNFNRMQHAVLLGVRSRDLLMDLEELHHILYAVISNYEESIEDMKSSSEADLDNVKTGSDVVSQQHYDNERKVRTAQQCKPSLAYNKSQNKVKGILNQKCVIDVTENKETIIIE